MTRQQATGLGWIGLLRSQLSLRRGLRRQEEAMMRRTFAIGLGVVVLGARTALAGTPPVPEPGTGTLLIGGAAAVAVILGIRAWRSRGRD